MIHTTELGNNYYESLDEAKEDGFTPVQVKTVLQFFKIMPRKAIINKESLIPFMDIPYMVFSMSENRYYLKTYRNYDIDDMFFYYDQKDRNDIAEVEGIFRYIADATLYILYSDDHLQEIKDMMTRCYKKKMSGGPPELWGNIFYRIMEEVLKYQAYKDILNASVLIGYRTVCKQFEDRIEYYWKQAYLKTQKT